MEPHYAELVGVAAAAASLYAAHAKTIIPLRVAAIVANLLAMAYSHMHGTYPTFVLNALLLPLNAWRLHQMLKLIRDITTAIGPHQRRADAGPQDRVSDLPGQAVPVPRRPVRPIRWSRARGRRRSPRREDRQGLLG